MNEIKKEKKLCICCMEEHDVKTVRMMEHTKIKDICVDYEATYFYCDYAEILYMDELQMRENNIVKEKAYEKMAACK